MKRLIFIFAFLLCCSAIQANARGIMTMCGAGVPVAGCTNTVYEAHTFESNTNWYDNFDSYDNNPSGQMTLDSNSMIGGTKSVLVSTSATDGGTAGTWTFAQTEFFVRVKIYISSTSSPAHGAGVIVASAQGTQGVGLMIYYDTDHFEYQVMYRLDSGTAAYVYGAGSTNTGVTISTDTVHTLYVYYKGGSGADGEVWAKLNSAEWVKNTGLDMDTKAAAISTFNGVQYSEQTGSANEADFIYYLDDILVQTCDPSI